MWTFNTTHPVPQSVIEIRRILHFSLFPGKPLLVQAGSLSDDLTTYNDRKCVFRIKESRVLVLSS